MEIILNGKEILDRKTLFTQLKEQIKSEEFYGDNLDALWDVLSSTDEKIKIIIVNRECLNNHLGEYAELLIELFHDLKDVNDFVSIDVK